MAALTLDHQSAGRIYPIPCTVERVTVTGESQPVEIRMEYKNSLGVWGVVHEVGSDDEDDSWVEPEGFAGILLMHIEVPYSRDVQWVGGDRTWWRF